MVLYCICSMPQKASGLVIQVQIEPDFIKKMKVFLNKHLFNNSMCM